jgi:hypothetical protein
VFLARFVRIEPIVIGVRHKSFAFTRNALKGRAFLRRFSAR